MERIIGASQLMGDQTISRSYIDTSENDEYTEAQKQNLSHYEAGAALIEDEITMAYLAYLEEVWSEQLLS